MLSAENVSAVGLEEGWRKRSVSDWSKILAIADTVHLGWKGGGEYYTVSTEYMNDSMVRAPYQAACIFYQM